MSVVNGWTPEQLDNAMKYGVCPECRSPLEVRIERTTPEAEYPDGRPTSTGIACPTCAPR